MPAPPLSPVLCCSASFALPQCARSIDVDPSIIWQVDALLSSRRGPRIERDFCASSAADSFTIFEPLALYDDLASFNGLFMHNFNLMPAVIAAAASHKAFGVFVVPVLPGCGPRLQRRAKSKAKLRPPAPWFDFLLSHSLLHFELPRAAFSGPGAQLGRSCGVLAVFAQFGVNGPIKAASGACKEKSFVLHCIPSWPPSRRLQAVAQMWPRCSPLADAVAPSRADDDSPAVPLLSVPPLSPPMVPPASPWCASVVESAADYPFPRVFKLALEVTRGVLDPFVGQRSHPVPQQPRRFSEAENHVARAKFVDARDKRGNVDGPRSARPFPNTRDMPWGIEPGKAYALVPKIRVTTDAAALGLATRSVNMLTWCPHMRRVHLMAYMLRDMVAWLGRGASVSCLDIPKCFRANKSSPSLFHLFVYRTVTEEFGVEFWTDMANTFGWVASEWGWQCCLAIIEWRMYKVGVRREFAFVDNFFCFHRPPTGAASVRSRFVAPLPPSSPVDLSPVGEADRVDAVIASFGLGSHEHQRVVTTFTGLGWEWSWDHPGEWPEAMVCEERKYVYYLYLFGAWASAVSITVAELQKAVGIMSWLRAGFPVGVASMTAIAKLATEGVGICRRHGLNRRLKTMKVTPEVKSAFAFWVARLSRWDRVCPIVMGFGPCSLPELRGWVDACSWNEKLPSGQRGGCGGVFFDMASSSLVGFAHEWTGDERGAAKRVLRESVPYYEALGIEWWLRLYVKACRAKRLLLATDSATVMQAVQRGFSGERLLGLVVESVRMSLADHFVSMRLRAIVGDRFNEVADLLSHGLIREACGAALRLFGVRLIVSRV